MPYIVISTQIRVENGPTIVGDEQSNPELMQFLGAELVKQLGNDFKEYRSKDPPRIVLDKLELKGYKVIAMAGIGQTCIWTLNKPPDSFS
ncbi:GTP cyclohydrolase 1 feedback regulatory protein-like [Uloborus diversus]|uniref:GTP cyclohydrolase 1 feedback regulatory protein-like n=1 Tax=Uloborus diversus TaxID=327109 RepID=UPI002409CE97|nr:GTP cyclohydrolase 1 feedback regulatory protein-like [Uloborus diversus]